MPTTFRFVAIIATNFYLFTGRDHFAMFIQAHCHSRLAPAAAYRFQFLQLVSYRQQAGGAGKQLAPKIRANAKAQYRHTAYINYLRQLVYLFAAQELRFVYQHAGKPLLLQALFNDAQEIGTLIKQLRFGR